MITFGLMALGGACGFLICWAFADFFLRSRFDLVEQGAFWRGFVEGRESVPEEKELGGGR